MTVLDRILAELEQYARGDRELEFTERYIYVNDSERLAIGEIADAEGRYDVATSKVVAAGFSKLYGFIEDLRIRKARKLLSDMLNDVKAPLTFRKLKTPLGEASSASNVKVRLYVHRELAAIIEETAEDLYISSSHLYRMCVCRGLVEYGIVRGRYRDELIDVVKKFISGVARFSGVVWSTLVNVYEYYGDELSDEIRREFEELLTDEFPELAGSGRYDRWQLYKVDKVLKARSVELAKKLKVSHSEYINKSIRAMAMMLTQRFIAEMAIRELDGVIEDGA